MANVFVAIHVDVRPGFGLDLQIVVAWDDLIGLR